MSRSIRCKRIPANRIPKNTHCKSTEALKGYSTLLHKAATVVTVVTSAPELGLKMLEAMIHSDTLRLNDRI